MSWKKKSSLFVIKTVYNDQNPSLKYKNIKLSVQNLMDDKRLLNIQLSSNRVESIAMLSCVIADEGAEVILCNQINMSISRGYLGNDDESVCTCISN